MDWNLKANAWDLAEFEQEAMTSIDALDRPTGFESHTRRGEFSIDLKLGGIGNSSEQSVNKWQQPGVPKMQPSPSGSTKRARGASNGTQIVNCLVDGCNSDLSACRDYHRRHKVCELHSKTPQVSICGHKQRFCQQCSRFHSLEEFDEGKRSCRKRLDGHNRRRRKPQPDPLSRPANFLSNFRGTQLLPFSSSHVYPSSAMMNPTWRGVVSYTAADTSHRNLHQQIPLPDKHNLFHGYSPSNDEGGKEFSFLQCGSSTTLTYQTTPEAAVCQPLLRAIAFPDPESTVGSSSSRSMFCKRSTTQVCASECALSLLSSTQTHASGNNMVQPNSLPTVQSIAPTTQHDHSLDSLLVSHGRDGDVYSPGMLLMRSGVSSGNKASETLPFNWQ